MYHTQVMLLKVEALDFLSMGLEVNHFGDEWLLNGGIDFQWGTPFFQTPLSV